MAEAVAASWIVNQLGSLPMALQAWGAWQLHERAQTVSSESLLPVAIGFMGLTMVAGIALEAKTLKQEGWTLNTVSTAVYAKTHNLPAAIAAGHLYGWAWSLANPADIASFVDLATPGDGNHFAVANLIARTAVGFTYSSVMNGAILTHKMDRVMQGVKWVKERTIDPAQRAVQSVRQKMIQEIGASLHPHQPAYRYNDRGSHTTDQN